jgi:hypothetical protein
MSIPLELAKREVDETYPHSLTNKESILAARLPWQQTLAGGIAEPSVCDLNTVGLSFSYASFACR